MRIENARVVFRQGYPGLLVDIDGVLAAIPGEQKPTPLAYGFVYLGADFEDSVPVLRLPADPTDGRTEGLPLVGFTDDPRILRLFLEFQRRDWDGTLVEGPLAIPAEEG